MKLTINDVKTFGIIGKTLLKVVEKRNTMPILAHFLLDAEKDKVKVISTDIETTIMMDISKLVTVQEPGKICIPAKQFFTMLKGKKGSLEISTSFQGRTTNQPQAEDIHWITIGSAKIAGLPWQDYPAWPDMSKAESIGIIPDLPEKIKKVFYAAGESDTRYTLNGLYFDFKEGNLVGTDGHRLSLVPIGAYKDQAVIVPRDALKVVESIKSDPEILLSKTNILFDYPQMQVLARIIEGKFPKYIDILRDITAEGYTRFTIKREEFLEKLDTVKPIVQARSNCVSIYYRKGELVIYGTNPDIGQIRETLPCRYEGNERQGFGMNAKYLTEALSQFDGIEVTLHFTDGLSPLQMEEDDKIALIMPLRGNNWSFYVNGKPEKFDYTCPQEDRFRDEVLQARIQRKIEKARKRPEIVIPELIAA